MIAIGLGANLQHPIYGAPINTLTAAVSRLGELGLEVTEQSSWYKTEPVPKSDQPWFVNGVVTIDTTKSAEEVLEILHQIEGEFGRVREIRWEARVLDLDLLCYGDYLTPNQDQLQGSVVPHPQMHLRGFVLCPLAEIAPDWVHPRLRLNIKSLIENLDEDLVFEVVSAGK